MNHLQLPQKFKYFEGRSGHLALLQKILNYTDKPDEL